MSERDPRAELEQLRRFVETLAQRIAALEGLLNFPRESPRMVVSTAQSPTIASSTARSSSSLTREELIAALTHWRLEKGIEVPQRYLRNRSTAQLRRMYDQIQAGSTYRLGRSWTAK